MNRDSIYLKSLLPAAGSARTIECVRKGRVILSRGQQSDAVYYVLAGVLGLFAANKVKEKIISLLGPGSFAGTECITSDEAVNPWTCRTLTDATVLKINRTEMLRMIETRETFAILFLDYLRDRITRYQEIVVNRTFDSVEMRLARTLLMLTSFGRDSDPLVVVPNIGHGTLAEVVGTTQSRVTFLMNRFKHLGFIAYRGHGPITIHASELSNWLKEAWKELPRTKAEIIQWPGDARQIN